MRSLAAGFALATAAMVPVSRAWASGSTFELDYSAPVGCASEVAFLTDVRERITDRRAVDTDGRRFRIRIVEDRGTYRGALETLDPPSVREVGGDTCEGVVRALVVFLALAVSPSDADTDSSADTLGSEGPPAVRDGEASRARLPMPSRASDGSNGQRRLRFGVDLRGIAATGVAPGLAPGGALAARLALATHPSFRWLAHVGGVVAYREEPALDGEFTFLWSAARIDAGPSVELGRFRVSGGPAVRAGVLLVNARGLPSATSSSAFWVDVGAFARLDRSLSPSIALSLMVELAAPLERKAFWIRGIEAPVHEIPPVVGTVSFGMTFGP